MHLLGQLKDGKLVYLNRQGLFLGSGHLLQIDISTVDVDKENEITRVYTTSDRTLVWPMPNNQRLVPRWGSHEVFPLDPNDFDIVETSLGGVTITKK